MSHEVVRVNAGDVCVTVSRPCSRPTMKTEESINENTLLLISGADKNCRRFINYSFFVVLGRDTAASRWFYNVR